MRSACYLLGTGEHVQYACFGYFYLAVVFVVASKYAVYLKEGRDGESPHLANECPLTFGPTGS